MGQSALVDDYIREGSRYVQQVLATGFEVTIAFWARLTDGSWYLYLATPAYDTKGPLGAYRELGERTRGLKDVWFDDDDVRVISSNSTMALAAAKLLETKPGRTKASPLVTRFDGSRLGGVDVDGVLIYPPLTATAS